MLFELWYILIQIKHSLNGDLNLIIREMRESGLQQRSGKFLDIQNVIRPRTQLTVNPSYLDQRKYVRQNGSVHRQPGRMRSIRHHGENVLQNISQVSLVKTRRRRFVLFDIL